MRVFSAALISAVVLAATLSAQLPVPDALLDAKRVYLSSEGIDRQWLERLAKAFQREKRLAIVPDATSADVIATLSRGKGAVVAVAITGVPAAVAAENDAFHLTIIDATTKAVLWDDHREASWTIGGAVDALSKRLHSELRKNATSR